MIDIIKLEEPVYAVLPVDRRESGMLELIFCEGSVRKLRLRCEGNVAEKNEQINSIKGVIDMICVEKHECVIVLTKKGFIEYLDSDTMKFVSKKKNGVAFASKFETDLITFLKKKKGTPLAIGKDDQEKYFWVYTDSLEIWLFDIKTAKKVLIIESDYASLEINQPQSFDLDKVDKERKVLIENEYVSKLSGGLKQRPAIDFDETSRFLVFPCILGVVFFDIQENEIKLITGKKERGERYLGLSVYQGDKKRNSSGTSGQGGVTSQTMEYDPCVFTWSFKRSKFCIFSNREPINFNKNNYYNSSRDVVEKKDNQQSISKNIQLGREELGNKVVLSTSLGDIYIRLFPEFAPKAVENFLRHSINGYYDNCIFHRVVQGYVQTGDPLNDGSGGESIWGKDFEDEFSELKHDKPFTVSMANSGKNTNGSQFFITTMPSQWLDNKHTIFGRVYKGTDVVVEIESLKTDHLEKPYVDVRIMGIKII